jgi:site-specific DNA recombinase
MLVGFASEQSHKYSADLSAHIRRGKKDAAESGKWPGGRVPDGYIGIPYLDGKKAKLRLEIDADRGPMIRGIFELAAEGYSTYAIARRLNSDGHRTVLGRDWESSRLHDIIRNPFYAGRLREGVTGDWPALVEPDVWDQLQSPVPPRTAGRPPTRGGTPALWKLARCNRCGTNMHSKTSHHIRQDGTRQRYYWCPGRQNGTCDAERIHGERVDKAIVEHLDQLFVDMEAWQADLMRGADEQRGLVEKELKTARAELLKLQQREDRVKELWLAAENADDPKAEAREEVYLELRQKRVAAEGSVKAAEDSLAAVPTEPPTDEVLDVYTELARIVRTGDATNLNERLALVFDHFGMDTRDDGTITVLPILRDDVIERFADPAGALVNIRTSLQGQPHARMLVAGEGHRPPTTFLTIESTARARPISPVMRSAACP